MSTEPTKRGKKKQRTKFSSVFFIIDGFFDTTQALIVNDANVPELIIYAGVHIVHPTLAH